MITFKLVAVLMKAGLSNVLLLVLDLIAGSTILFNIADNCGQCGQQNLSNLVILQAGSKYFALYSSFLDAESFLKFFTKIVMTKNFESENN